MLKSGGKGRTAPSGSPDGSFHALQAGKIAGTAARRLSATAHDELLNAKPSTLQPSTYFMGVN